MIEILLFLIFFILSLFSTIGYGLFFHKVCFYNLKVKSENETIYFGFFGLFLITLISLITSLFFSHNFIHNLFLHFFWIVIFSYFKI